MHSLNLPDVFSWSRTSKTKCEEALRSSEVKLKIEKLDEIVDTCSVNVQKLINEVTDVMVSAGNLFLFRQTFKAKRKKKKKKKKTRQINKKWYDKVCQKLLRDVKSAKNAFNRNSTDALFRIKHYKKFKEYKRIAKLKKRRYKDKLTSILNDAMDKVPQTAWKIINEVKKNAVPTDKIEFINRNEWYNHFRNLLQPDSNHFDKNRKE